MAGFVDECALNVRGGDGGAGTVSFRREAHVPRGGPDGGDGGPGGDVWLVADHNVASLLAFRDHPHRRATDGTHGTGKGRHGTGGKDTIVAVPQGTTVRAMEGGALLADLVNHGDRWLAAAGGRGGRGNARFLSNTRRAPSFAEQGERGRAALAAARAASHGRRRARRLPELGQEHVHQPDLGCQAQDRRLPLHDPRAQPRRRARSTTTSRWSSRTSPA